MIGLEKPTFSIFKKESFSTVKEAVGSSEMLMCFCKLHIISFQKPVTLMFFFFWDKHVLPLISALQ